MRKVTAGLFHAIDGAVEAPNEWQFDQFDDELGATLGGVVGATTDVVLGRKGYEEWAGFWPTADFEDEFKSFINSVPKHVATRTLKAPLAWQNASLIKGDAAAFVRELKGKPGGEIAVMAGISIVRELFLAGVIDELTLITHPVVAGEGRRHLFQPGDAVTRLELKACERTSKGNVVSTYALRA